MTPILHLTHVNNLAGIVAAGGLWSPNHRPAGAPASTSIAHLSIQSQRATRPVTCGPRGVLHDYVPFSFGARSPMLYSNHKGNVPTNPNGQQPLVYLVGSCVTN